MLDKLVIGAAQFGLPYGINNTSNESLSKAQVHDILNCASDFGINEIDLAENYGDVYEKLHNFDLSNFQITTKLSLKNTSTNLYNYFSKKLDLIKKDSFKSILIHNPEDLYHKDFNKFIKSIEKLRELGITKKVGISIYNADEYYQAKNFFSPEVVQLPYNFFNRDVIGSIRLEEHQKEIYIRSIFLQGALLQSKTKKLDKLKKENIKEFKIYDNYLLENSYSPIQGALSCVLNESGISKIIIGIESKEQLLEIIDVVKEIRQPASFPDVKIKNELIDPRLWK